MKHGHRWKNWLLIILASLAWSAQAQSLKFGMAYNEAVQDVAAELLKEIYRRAGLSFTINPLPPARITVLVLKDELEGEIARIAPYFEKNPTLHKVEPAYYYLITTAFARSNKNIRITSAEDLKPYRVGIIRGVYHAALATEGVSNLTVTDTVTQLFRMLDAGHIDIAVDVGINGQDTINELGLKNIKPVGVLARHDFHNALIRSRADIAPKIGAVIREMKASGELDRMTRAAEQKRLRRQP